MKWLLVVTLFIFFSYPGAGQQRTLPAGLDYQTYKLISPKNLPVMDTAAFFSKLRSQASGRITSETVAYNFKTQFAPDTEGTWKTIVPGFETWFLKLRSNGAYGMSLVLTDVSLLPDEKLYIYNQHNLRGPYTSLNIPRSGILP